MVDNRDGFIEVGKNEFDSINIGNIFEQASSDKGIRSKSKRVRLESDFVRRYKGETTGIHTYKVIRKIDEYLLGFIDIFSIYIELVEGLVPRNSLKTPKVLSSLDVIYSFNYSSTTSRLYNREHRNFLHGKAGESNIVLGISELDNQLLIDEKAYGFVKYYQKLVNNTNYKFLSGNKDLKGVEEGMQKGSVYWNTQPYEIYIWGQSLDSSDSDYIKEIFSFNKGVKPSVYLIIYYFPSPHAQLANLISIMGKDVIEEWMKEGWLEFVQSPNIYALNNTEDYVDQLSKNSEGNIFT